jgi:hypothetical protein
VGWYARGERSPDRPGFSPYNTQNWLALAAVLTTGKPGDAESLRRALGDAVAPAALAIRAGAVAGERYRRTREYFDALMVADGHLIAALLEESLAAAPEAAARTQQLIAERYRDVRVKLAETARQRDSVVSQLKLLAEFFATKDRPGAGAAVAERLLAIAASLDPPAARPAPDDRDPQAEAEDAEPEDEPSGEPAP